MNNVKLNAGQTRICLFCLWIFFHVCAVTQPVRADVVTDGSMGAAQNITGPDFMIPETLGTLSGNNLFHSFTTFDIGAAQRAIFTSTTVTIANLISRVTGGSPSSIEGEIRYLPAPGTTPGFFFINPAGVTFGNGASIDVPGAFHVSTADAIEFSTGDRFFADPASASVLSIAAPESFGFLPNGLPAANVTLTSGADLQADSGAISLVGGDVSLTDAAVRARSGLLRVAAVGDTPGPVPFIGDLPGLTGAITLANGSVLQTDSDASGNPAGAIRLRGGSVNLDDSEIISQSINAGDAGNVTIDSSGNTTLLAGSRINVSTFGGNDAGSIRITADALLLDDANISSNANDAGDAGNVLITTRGNLVLRNDSRVATSTFADGNAGNVAITITEGDLDLSNAEISSVNASAGAGFGAAGVVNIDVAGDVGLADDSVIRSSTTGSLPGVPPPAPGPGQDLPGTINITADTLFLDGEASIASATSGAQDAGTVSIVTNSGILLVNANAGVENRIRTDTSGSGTAGDISLVVLNGAISLNGFTEVTSESTSATTGEAGRLLLEADTVSLDNNAALSTNTSGDIAGVGGQSASSGTIIVRADDLSLVDSSISSGTNGGQAAGLVDLDLVNSALVENSSISTETLGVGAAGQVLLDTSGAINLSAGSSIRSDSSGSGIAGDVEVSGASMLLADGAKVSSDANSTGNGGNVTVQITGALELAGNSAISADTYDDANGGFVDISAGSLLLENDSLIASRALGADTNIGNAGLVSVDVGGAISVLSGSIISSSTQSGGAAGMLRVDGGSILVDGISATIIDQPSEISARAFADSSGQTGQLLVDADASLTLSNQGRISIANDATVADPALITPGDAAVRAPTIRIVNDSQITANSTGNVDASDIRVDFGRLLYIDPSSISTSAFLGNGGAITINGSGLLQLDSAFIQTSVTGGPASGNGGNINISVGSLLLTNGFIQANTTGAGASGGTININTPLLLASGNSLVLGGDTQIPFQQGFGLNVIQAAAPDGVSGDINSTAPELDLSGILGLLATSLLDAGGLGRSPCETGGGSSLGSAGRGGMPPSAGDPMQVDRPASGGSPAPALQAAAPTLQLASLAGAGCI